MKPLSGVKAMIFAAGLGSRLKPMTDYKPKALVEIQGISLIEYAVRKLRFYGVSDIIINVHHFSEQIAEFVKTHDLGVNITISDESNQLMNTGGGLLKAKDFFDSESPFFVVNVDIISSIDLAKMYEMHIASGAKATLAVSKRKTSRYLLFDANEQLCGWENCATQTRIFSRAEDYENLHQRAFSGIQLLSPQIFDCVTEQGSFSIIDMYVRMAQSLQIQAFDHSGDFWVDVGKFDSLQEIIDLLKLQKLDFLD